MEKPMQSDQLKIFLLELLEQHADVKSIDWLLLQKERIIENPSEMKFFVAFSQASRYFKKKLLELSEAQKSEANRLAEGFSPDTWDELQTARSFLMLHFQANDVNSWLDTINKLFETGDMHELQALYASLPIMPFPKAMTPRAVEGLRTNITSIFDAIALSNPYPFQYLDEGAWNQMLIKAIFLQRPLYKIFKADERANANLANILIDYAHERWAAGRNVVPELWRFVGPYLKEENMADIQKAIQSGNPLEKNAVLLACCSSTLKAAKDLLDQNPDIKSAIEKGKINWEMIGRKFEQGI